MHPWKSQAWGWPRPIIPFLSCQSSSRTGKPSRFPLVRRSLFQRPFFRSSADGNSPSHSSLDNPGPVRLEGLCCEVASAPLLAGIFQQAANRATRGSSVRDSPTAPLNGFLSSSQSAARSNLIHEQPPRQAPSTSRVFKSRESASMPSYLLCWRDGSWTTLGRAGIFVRRTGEIWVDGDHGRGVRPRSRVSRDIDLQAIVQPCGRCQLLKTLEGGSMDPRDRLRLRHGLVRGSTRPLSAASPMYHTDHTGVPELSLRPAPHRGNVGVFQGHS